MERATKGDVYRENSGAKQSSPLCMLPKGDF